MSSKHNRGEGWAHKWRRPSPEGGRKRFLAAVALMVGASLTLAGGVSIAIAGSASAAAPGSGLTVTSAAAAQNQDQTVTLTVSGDGGNPGGACKLVFTTATAASPGYSNCIPDNNGDFSASLTTAGAYTASSISWEITDANPSNVFIGPESTTVTPYKAPTNQAPVAKLSVTPDSGDAPLAVTADGSGSTDDKAVETYAFTWGDGTSGTGDQSGATAMHTYASDGTFMVTLTVKDAEGLSDQATKTVTVNKAATPPPPATKTVSWVMLDSNGSASNITFPQDEVSPKLNPAGPTCGHTIQTDVYNYASASDKATVDKLIDAEVLNSGDDASVFVSATFSKQPACTTPTPPAPPTTPVPVPPTSPVPVPPSSTTPLPPTSTVPAPPVKTSPVPAPPTKTTSHPAPPTHHTTPPAPPTTNTPLVPQQAATDMVAPGQSHLTLAELLLIVGGGLIVVGSGLAVSDVRSRRRA